MGKLNIFKIELSQPRGVFYGGQWLQGYVCVELNAPMKMRGTWDKKEESLKVHSH